jgi:curved DNA-binding protein CbpA
VDEHAPLETIRAAYRREVKRCHPDALGTGVDNSTDPLQLARFLAVQEAWQTLSDPELRRQYDLSRRMDRKARWNRS